MGFLCINNEIKKDVSQESLINQEFLRDNGLSNVYNLKPKINFCQEIFLSPEYYVTGVIKLTSGYTSTLTGCTTGTTGIYNLDYTGDITVDFIITGDTNYRNYDGNFCTKTFSKEYWNPIQATGGLINGSENISYCNSFSAITQSEPDILKGEITVGNLPYKITLNTKDNLLYVSNIAGSDKSISIIDAETNVVVNTLGPSTLGFTPGASTYDPVNNRLFIIENSTNKVWVLDCNTNTVIFGPITYGVFTYLDLIYNEINQTICVIGGSKILTIDCNTFVITLFTNLSFLNSKLISYNSIDSKFYVFSNAIAGSVDVVDASTGILNSTIAVSGSPEFNGSTFDSTNNRIYATVFNNNKVIIIDCATLTYTSLTTPTSNPYAIGFDSLNNNIFYSTFTGGKVYRLDCTTNEIEKSFDLTAEVRYILYNPINNTVYGTRYGNQKVAYITSDYIKQEILEGTLPKTWGEYLIRPYYNFISKECSPGKYFDSWSGTVQYNNFQSDSDYYFMTVVNPPTPQLQAPGGASASANQTLVSDNLYVNGISGPLGSQSVNGELNYFILRSIPSNQEVLLVVNGVQLTQGYDFNLISQGYGVPPIVKINGEIKTTDWVIATYLVGVPDAWSTNFGDYKIDTILLDSFTTTTTPNYRVVGDNSLNYNPVTGNYEFFTTQPINDASSILLTVNGIKLAFNQQFFISTSFPGRIIFDKLYTTFNTGDVISVLYLTKNNGTNNNNYGSLTNNKFTVQWSVPTTLNNSDKLKGRFVVNAYDNTTNNLLFQNYVNFVEGQSNYESTFTSLPLNVYFRFTVTFEATYTGYLDNKVTTCSSAEGFFDTTNRFINNTY